MKSVDVVRPNEPAGSCAPAPSRAARVGSHLALAAIFGVFWIAVLAPFVHSIGHRADHVHTAYGLVRDRVLVSTTHQEGPRDRRHAAQPDDTRERRDPRHGRGSSLHFDGVLFASDVRILALPPGILPETRLCPLEDRFAGTVMRGTAQARAPPRA